MYGGSSPNREVRPWPWTGVDAVLHAVEGSCHSGHLPASPQSKKSSPPPGRHPKPAHPLHSSCPIIDRGTPVVVRDLGATLVAHTAYARDRPLSNLGHRRNLPRVPLRTLAQPASHCGIRDSARPAHLHIISAAFRLCVCRGPRQQPLRHKQQVQTQTRQDRDQGSFVWREISSNFPSKKAVCPVVRVSECLACSSQCHIYVNMDSRI